MHPDITRNTYNPANAFTRVVMQQGRLQLDADWNEQVDILQGLRRALARDVIGADGTPDPDGYKITPHSDGGGLSIAAGRYYLGGWSCRNAAAVNVAAQPDLSPYPLPNKDGDYCVYLDVWTRTVTALEDPMIADPALNGLSTAVRSQVVWQVKLRPGDVPPDTAAAALMTAATQSAKTGTSSTLVAADSGYAGLENFLYNVQIHNGGAPGKATLKWSRYNASLAYGIVAINGRQVRLTSLGRTAALGLRPGDWVELASRETQLHGAVGRLYCIEQVDQNEKSITLDQQPGTAISPDGQSFDLGQVARFVLRWDQKDGVNDDGVIAIPAQDKLIALENAIAVKFTAASEGATLNLAAGDFWEIPARTGHGLLLPKGDRVGSYQPRPPNGVTHTVAPLAQCKRIEGKWSVAQDLRKVYAVLSDVTGGGPASRVSYSNSAYPIYAGVANVKEALDRIGARAGAIPRTVRIAPDGQFPTLAAFVKGLPTLGAIADDLHVVIAAPPGTHSHVESDAVTLTPWSATKALTLTISGESPDTEIKFTKQFSIAANGDNGFARVTFENVRLCIDSLSQPASGRGMSISAVDALVFDGVSVFANITVGGQGYQAACTTQGVRRIVLRDTACDMLASGIGGSARTCIGQVFPGGSDPKDFIDKLKAFLSSDDIRGDLRQTLIARAAALADDLQGLSAAQRGAIQNAFTKAATANQNASAYPFLWEAFKRFAAALARLDADNADRLVNVSIALFEAQMWCSPASALLCADVPQSIVMEGCRIMGVVAFGVENTGTALYADAALWSQWAALDWSDGNQKTVADILAVAAAESAGTLRISDCEIATVTWGLPEVKRLTAYLAQGAGAPPPRSIFESVTVTASRLLGPLSCLAGGALSIATSEIMPTFPADAQLRSKPDFNVAHIAIAPTAMASANRGQFKIAAAPRPTYALGVMSQPDLSATGGNAGLAVRALSPDKP